MAMVPGGVMGNFDLSCTLLFFPLIIIIANNVNIAKKILSNILLLKISSLSTSIYFTHVPLIFAIRIIDIYFSLNIDYSLSVTYWGIVTLVLVVAYSFKVVVEDKLTKCLKTKFL